MGLNPSERSSRAAWFALGFLATMCQVLLLREFLVVCAGSELGIAVLLCTWLLGIAAGALISLPLQRRRAGPWLLPLLLTALALSCPLGLAALRLSPLLLQIPAGALAALSQLTAVALAVVLPPGLLVGLTFPLACSAESATSRGAGGAAAIGRVYALEAAGSFSAGMLHTWLLVTLLPALQTALLSAALLCLTAAWFARRPGDRPAPGLWPAAVRWFPVIAGLLLLVPALLPGPGGQLDRLTLEMRWAALRPGIRLLDTVETPYQRLEAGRLGSQTVFVSNGSVLATFPDPYNATLWGHFLLSAHPAPQRILLVGGLESGLLAPMLRHPAVEEICCLEQDPALPALYRHHAVGQDLHALADPRFTLLTGDARRWINKTSAMTVPGNWDLIVILLPDPTTAMINRYYTREFYAGCRRLLNTDGLLLCRVTASANYLDDETGALARSVYATLLREFPAVEAGGGERVIFAASKRARDSGFFRAERLVRHFESSGTVDPGFSVMAFHSLIEDQRSEFLERVLSSSGSAMARTVNSDWRPLAQAHTLRLWSRFSGDSLDRWFRLLFRPVPFWPAATALALPLIWALAPLARRRSSGVNRRSVLVAVTAAGFAGLALELVCLHVYQGAFGNLYRMIGSVVALFMLGLTLGGAAASPLGDRLSPTGEKGHRRVLALGLGGQALMALAAPALLRLAGSGVRFFSFNGVSQALVLLLVCCTGWFTGLTLPAAGGMLIGRPPGGTGSASGLVNCADHLGAAAAAALVGLVVVPRFGVLVGSGLLALLTSCCAVRVWLEGRA